MHCEQRCNAPFHAILKIYGRSSWSRQYQIFKHKIIWAATRAAPYGWSSWPPTTSNF